MKYRFAIDRFQPTRLRLLSPVVSFPIVWGVGILLGQIHLLRSQQNWSAEVWGVLAAVPVAFVVGGLAGRWLAGKARPAWLGWGLSWTAGPSNRTILVGCTAVGWLELIHQFAVSGSVPLLSTSIDTSRFAQPGGPTVILTNLLTVAIVVALVKPRRPLARESRFELGIVAVCMVGFALQGGRGSLVLPVVVAVIARWAYWGRPRVPVYAWLALGAAALVLVSGLFYLRTAPESDAFQTELYGEVLPGLPSAVYPLIPVDLAYATNFQTLAAVVGHYPGSAPFGYGAYSVQGFDLVAGSAAKDLSDTTREINPPWTTATLAGSLWADGGFPAVALGSGLTGLLASLAYWLYRRTRQLRFGLISSYFLYLALFGVYTSLWTQHPDWLLITPALFLVGTLAQRGMPLAVEPPETASTTSAPPGGRGHPGSVWRPSRALVLALIGAVGFVAVSGVVLASVLPAGGALAPVVGRLPALFAKQAGPTVAATDAGSRADNSTLYRLERGLHGQALLRSDGVGEDPVRELTRIAGQPHAGAGFDLYTDPGRVFPRLFQFRPLGRKWLAYTVSDTLTGRELSSGRFRVPSRGDRKRWLFIARWRGPEPDLFIVDSGAAGQQAEVRIRSGESGFKGQIARLSIASPDLDPRRWQVDVLDVFDSPTGKARRPDLVMSSNTGSVGRAEEHVLSGESRFKTFVYQRATAIGARAARPLSFRAGRSDGAASALLFAIPHGESRTPIRAVELFPAR